MFSAKLSNCPKCGKLFLRVRAICDECFQKQEEDFQEVSSYLWEHPGCTIQELSNSTKVSVAQIRQFILANRIIVSQYVNLSYPCENCGSMIREGVTCSNCVDNLNQLAIQVAKENQGNEKKGKIGSYKTHSKNY